MPTPDASQYTQFRKSIAVSDDKTASPGTKPNRFTTSYSVPNTAAITRALFLPSANKIEKFRPCDPVLGPSPNVTPTTVTANSHTFTVSVTGAESYTWYTYLSTPLFDGGVYQYNTVDGYVYIIVSGSSTNAITVTVTQWSIAGSNVSGIYLYCVVTSACGLTAQSDLGVLLRP